MSIARVYYNLCYHGHIAPSDGGRALPPGFASKFVLDFPNY